MNNFSSIRFHHDHCQFEQSWGRFWFSFPGKSELWVVAAGKRPVMPSSAASAALQRAAALAASVAERDAMGNGSQDGEEKDPQGEKLNDKLAKAKEKARQGRSLWYIYIIYTFCLNNLTFQKNIHDIYQPIFPLQGAQSIILPVSTPCKLESSKCLAKEIRASAEHSGWSIVSIKFVLKFGRLGGDRSSILWNV